MTSPASPDIWSTVRERTPFVVVVALSTAWIVLAFMALSRIGFESVLALPLNELSALMVAFIGPLVGLWLVAAILAQRRELADLRRRLVDITSQARQSLQHVEVQSRAMLEMEVQLKRSLAADTRRLALQDLAAQACIVGERLGILKNEAVDVAWARFGSGDTGAFVQPFLSYAVRHPDLSDRMGDAVMRDPQARRALSGFVRRYERLAATVGDDKLALDILEEGPMGQGYRIFKSAEARALAAAPPA